MHKGKVILAYSGGLDTSVAIKWLQEKGYEVITLTADVGQNIDLEAAKEKALKIGASKAYVMDLKKEFVESMVWPALKANALYEGKYPLNSALSRPLMAKYLARDSFFSKALANSCAYVCEQCALECSKFPDQMSQNCAQVCQHCAQACRAFAA